MDICIEGDNEELIKRFIQKSVTYYDDNIRYTNKDNDEITIYMG